MTLKQLFNKTLTGGFITIPDTKGDYKLIKSGTTLFLVLEGSNQEEDWKHNFDFPTKPYHDMPKTWKAHRGFVKVWKSIVPHIEEAVADPTLTQIITIGYSHGAALACLAQEYIWFNRPDIRDNCYAFAFESPRVFCGCHIPAELKERWANLYVFRNGWDIVTHVPPTLFGFKHVGTLIHIGKSRDKVTCEGGYIGHGRKWIPKCILEHDYPNVRTSLDEYEKSLTKDDKLKQILKEIKA